MHKLDKQYYKLLKEVLYNGSEETNKRTQSKIKVSLHKTISYTINKKLNIISCRKIFPHVAAAEVAWACQGTQDTSFIKKYSKMWTKFEDTPGKVIPAYGYRWSRHFGRNQLEDALLSLKEDKTNRQIWVTAWDPAQDGLQNIGKYKNVPCPIGFSLNILDNKISMSVYLRSSDIIIGLPYDMLFYSLLLIGIGNSLNIKTNQITFYLNNAHIYEAHYKIAEKLIEGYKKITKSKNTKESFYCLTSINLPKENLRSIKSNPEEYVEKIKIKSKKARGNNEMYNPIIEAVL